MSRASIVRGVSALIAGVGAVALAAKEVGFAVVGGFVGVRVGSPGAAVELARPVLTILVAVLFGVLAIRFAIRAFWRGTTVRAELGAGGKLLATVGWAAWGLLVFELWYRQCYLGWATVFGDLGRSLAWSAVAVALAVLFERLVPWSRAPRGVRPLGLALVVAVAVLTAASAWSHRAVVTGLALAPVVLVGLALVASGVRRVESGPRLHSLVELGLASMLLAGPFFRWIG